MEVFRLNDAVGEDEPGGESSEEQRLEPGSPGSGAVEIENRAEKGDAEKSEAGIEECIVLGKTEKNERVSLARDEKKGIDAEEKANGREKPIFKSDESFL